MKIIVLISLFLLVQSPVKASEENELKQLVISLNSHVVNLEKRVKELEKLVKVNNINISNSKVTWRKLKKRMTFSQVRSILGEPLNIEAGVLTYWYYTHSTSKSMVVFGSNDRLYSWKEPQN